MTSAAVPLRPWSRRRRWGTVGLIFGIQLVLIFWLGRTPPIHPRPAAPGLTLKLAGDASAELLALNDPTLFALPHRQGSAGPPSRAIPPPDSPSFRWPEPTNSLFLAVDQLGTVFGRFIKTNAFDSLRLPAKPEAMLTLPDLPPAAVAEEQSTLRLEGDLARRRLATPLALRSCTNLEILSNSVVRIAVDGEGRPVSPTLLSRSGSTEADQYALEQARAARFDPVRRQPADPALKPASELTWGRMVFRWHTVPPPPADTPPANP